MQLWHGVHFKFGKGWEPKLLRMCVAFNWVGISGSKLVERCRGLELLSCKFVHLCVCWGVWKMDESERYLWHLDVF